MPLSKNIQQNNRIKFKKTLKDFFEWVETNFSDNSDILDTITAVKLALINIKFVLDNFMESIEPHIDEIMTSNDDYFINSNSDELGIDSEYHQLTDKIKVLWPTLDTGKQNYLRKTFKLLTIKGVLAKGDSNIVDKINKYAKKPFVSGVHF